MSPSLRLAAQTASLAVSAAVLLVAGVLALDLMTGSPCQDHFAGAFLGLAAPSIYSQLFLSSWLCYVILSWSKVRASLMAAVAVQALLVFGTVTYYSLPSLFKPPAICE